jgi:hypothetical protein
MMNSFDHMVSSLVSTDPETKFITKDEFEIWYNSFFVFDRIKGQSLAKSFMDHFEYSDGVLTLALSDEMTKFYIENNFIK